MTANNHMTNGKRLVADTNKPEGFKKAMICSEPDITIMIVQVPDSFDARQTVASLPRPHPARAAFIAPSQRPSNGASNTAAPSPTPTKEQ